MRDIPASLQHKGRPSTKQAHAPDLLEIPLVEMFTEDGLVNGLVDAAKEPTARMLQWLERSRQCVQRESKKVDLMAALRCSTQA
jgi:hypothetical protein